MYVLYPNGIAETNLVIVPEPETKRMEPGHEPAKIYLAQFPANLLVNLFHTTRVQKSPGTFHVPFN